MVLNVQWVVRGGNYDSILQYSAQTRCAVSANCSDFEILNCLDRFDVAELLLAVEIAPSFSKGTFG
jgi:hypothetical protein